MPPIPPGRVPRYRRGEGTALPIGARRGGNFTLLKSEITKMRQIDPFSMKTASLDSGSNSRTLACINGVCLFGNKLDRIHAEEERADETRAQLLAAWRR